jgi:tRNA-dihydrouridine synthase B
VFNIGQFYIDNPLFLAPMAGVTDLPFRKLCLSLGAGVAVGEMVSSDIDLYASRKSRLRLIHDHEIEPRIIQIAGSCPDNMAGAARKNVEQGAQIIDINMGCPAKKVLKKAAGSALMQDEGLVADILRATVNAVSVPVTLKIRTGWARDQRNAVAIARIAEAEGIQMLSVHGRTREDRFMGQAEYDTIAAVQSAVSIPVIANGDIDSGPKAAEVLKATGAQGLMIGRAAQGNPWIFREISSYLATGQAVPPPALSEISTVMLGHLRALHAFYGPVQGVRIARKHIAWYVKSRMTTTQFLPEFFAIDDPDGQISHLSRYLQSMEYVQEANA